MSQPTTTPGYFPRVRLFLANSHVYDKGKPTEKKFTPADLTDAMANYWKLNFGDRPLFDATLIEGHPVDLPDGSHTRVPALGKVAAVWKEGEEFFGSLAEVDPATTQAMNSGKYRGLSCEFYDGPDQAEIPEGLRRGARGLILKRVSLLGGHPPRCKGLGCPPWKAGDPPAESRAWASGECEWTPEGKDARYTFADPMETPTAIDREQLMAVIKKAGFGEDFAKTLSDEQASILVADLADRALTALGGGGNDGDGKGTMSKEQLIAELQKLGQDPQALSQMSEPALQELYKHLSAAKGQPTAGTTMGDRAGGVTTQPVALSLGTVKEYAEAVARTEVHRQKAPDLKRDAQAAGTGRRCNEVRRGAFRAGRTDGRDRGQAARPAPLRREDPRPRQRRQSGGHRLRGPVESPLRTARESVQGQLRFGPDGKSGDEQCPLSASKRLSPSGVRRGSAWTGARR
jgi:hypothetical protein